MKSGTKFIVIIIMSFVPIAVNSSEKHWLSLESDGLYILKLYGLPKGDYITVNLFSSAVNDKQTAVKQFFTYTDKDKKRLIRIDAQYHVQLTTIPGLSVITTMRRSTDQLGKSILVHYQAFYLENKKQIWYVRTELNDSLSLLTQNYSKILDHTFIIMQINKNRDVNNNGYYNMINYK
ncbi:hypothetical protein A3196_12390 [Candidatus Thiodiazotropha endoloripes]|uniref:Uncharacterized protein n=1 Tax=Candidatus Thiodiazotropha endoloripes TaxID=1818881 RepID=A0A1E2URW1_9GAMM|nr:hypothetical protein A3196_12390 [Candidatus Thiodiazotropha endoloripes]